MDENLVVPKFFTSIHLTGLQYSSVEQGWDYPSHRHPIFEIMYCEKGHLIEQINGRTYSLPAGTAIFIKSGITHSVRAAEDSVFFNFHFSMDHQEVRMILQGIEDPILTSDDHPAESSKLRMWMEHFIEQFTETYRPSEGAAGVSGSQVMSIHSLRTIQFQTVWLQFMTFLFETQLQKTTIRTSMHQSKLQIAHEVAYLLENDTTYSMLISDLSSKLNVHRTYICNCFREVYGVSPKYYAQQLRINRAKELLQQTDLPVSGIAQLLSFSSTEYFCRFFRSHVGFTPYKYRTSPSHA
ncbi:AraC family transcriptional regulator [Paenibacillus sp. SAF-054]|uniref:helix-turn-helix transcriptional regulator n=1 Tax=unclassified Paenibacillus TaxID=185978 RepID=UPI003F7E29B1